MAPTAKKGRRRKKKGKKGSGLDMSAEAVKKRYDAKITELNRFLSSLRSRLYVIETRNIELETKIKSLEEDRGDIATFLKTIIENQKAEIQKLQNVFKEYEEQKETAGEMCKTQIEELQKEYDVMCEELTMRIRELNDKLFCLHRLSGARKDMMEMFDVQNSEKNEQLMLYKQELYEMEKKFNTEKDRMHKEMKFRLAKLSEDFENIVEIRNACQSYTVIKENVIYNIEYEATLNSNVLFERSNIKLKDLNTTYRLQSELIQFERNTSVAKVEAQLKIIDALSNDIKSMLEDIEKYKKIEDENIVCLNKIDILKKEINWLQNRIKILEQNAHTIRSYRNITSTNIEYFNLECKRIADILLNCTNLIENFLNVPVPKNLLAQKQTNLLTLLITLIDPSQQDRTTRSPVETIVSPSVMYAESQLGFVPKPVHLVQTVLKEKGINPRLSFLAEPEIVYLNELDDISMVDDEDEDENEELVLN